MSSQPVNAPTQEPQVQNPTHYSPRCRNTFFLEIKQNLTGNQGNDPFDYEQKLPEDKQYEEFGPAARVWRTYLEECALFDHEMVEGWKDGLDVLLVFAGLFSAVVTTFVVQTSQSLQLDYAWVTAPILYELTNVQLAAANGVLVDDIPRSGLTPFSDFRAAASDLWVNRLWFTSLSLTLAIALVAVLMKQWTHLYMAVSSGTPRDRCRVRHWVRRSGACLSPLDSFWSSLRVLLAGLVIFLVPLHLAIASVVGAITFSLFAVYTITNLLPILYLSCPYKTPLFQYVFSP
ncbi:uncharacterized protein ARMOST_14499 [Armillaria ostoyae]|uniref:DUF6535 domain-containing protein n=1 Tax=Armillaria ostoyae TaxID=47428 RepID=A0A284RQP2_ARMOS|nr:uncharacterized protein ARMOST_14499 [Armillaria ostoyae]